MKATLPLPLGMILSFFLGMFTLAVIMGGHNYHDNNPISPETEQALTDLEDGIQTAMVLMLKKILENRPIPDWEKLGGPPATLKTSNRYWVGYLPQYKVSFVADRKRQTILHVDEGLSAQDWLQQQSF